MAYTHRPQVRIGCRAAYADAQHGEEGRPRAAQGRRSETGLTATGAVVEATGGAWIATRRRPPVRAERLGEGPWGASEAKVGWLKRVGLGKDNVIPTRGP